MGFFSKLFGGGDTAIAVDGDVVTIRRAEIAAILERPREANSKIETTEPCERCNGALREAFITTGGALGDPDVWRDHPVAVDGWACVSCGVFRYPRKIDPARIHELTEEGAALGRAGDYAAAEVSFARIVWNWPGYFPGHVNYAEATRTRLHATKETPDVARRLRQRMVEQYEAAIEAAAKQPNPSFGRAIARAYQAIAVDAIEADANDRALRFIDEWRERDDVTDEDRAEADRLRTHVLEGRGRFDKAQKVVMPFIRLQGRPTKPIETGDQRKAIVTAMETLSELVVKTPAYWQAAWLLGKSKEALGDAEGALAAWREGHARVPDADPIARDFSMLLLERGENAEALAVNRTICASKPDAANLCNLAVAELLNGDLDRAEEAVTRGLALDPADAIAHAVKSRIGKYRAGAPLPRTMKDLERG